MAEACRKHAQNTGTGGKAEAGVAGANQAGSSTATTEKRTADTFAAGRAGLGATAAAGRRHEAALCLSGKTEGADKGAAGMEYIAAMPQYMETARR